MGLEMQNSAAEIKLRAERRAGEMLAKKNLRGGDRKSKSHDATLKLPDLGVSRTQSSRWQTLAKLPEKEFEGYVQGHKEKKREITTAGALKLCKESDRKKAKAESI